jgi:hypothetical protein
MRRSLIFTAGIAFTALALALAARSTGSPAFAPAHSDPVRLAFSSDFDLPYLVTRGGSFYSPTGSGHTREAIEAQVHDVYVDAQRTIWAATSAGLYTRADAGEWTLTEDVPPITAIDLMHGFTFTFGPGGLVRGHDGDWGRLALPQPDQPADQFVMLRSHDHVLLNGGLYLTPDMGLSWRLLESDTPARLIWPNGDGDLLAVTDADIQLWNVGDGAWRTFAPLPPGAVVEAIRTLGDRVYALADGQVWEFAAGAWQPIEPRGRFTAIETRRNRELYVADAQGRRIWWTGDGNTWESAGFSLP